MLVQLADNLTKKYTPSFYVALRNGREGGEARVVGSLFTRIIPAREKTKQKNLSEGAVHAGDGGGGPRPRRPARRAEDRGPVG